MFNLELQNNVQFDIWWILTELVEIIHNGFRSRLANWLLLNSDQIEIIVKNYVEIYVFRLCTIGNFTGDILSDNKKSRN